MRVRDLERLSELLGALYEEPDTREGVRSAIAKVRAEVAVILDERGGAR